MASNSPGTFEIVALELSKALSPLAARLHDPHHVLVMLAQLGLRLPEHSFSPAFLNATQTVHTAAHQIPPLSEDLITAINGGDTLDIIAKALPVAEQLALVISAIDTIATELGNMG